LLRVEYHERLNEARDTALRLFAWSRELLKSGSKAFLEGDAKAAGRVLSDDVVSEGARSLRATCIDLIWRQQPMADELRMVAALLQMAADFERISFHEHELAKQAMRLTDNVNRPEFASFSKLAAETDAMLVDVQEALRNVSGDIAQKVIDRTDIIDKLAEDGLLELQSATVKNAESIPAATNQLLGLTAMKRIAEHVENCAWHIRGIVDVTMA
jgi:phosphate transport system protein